MQRVLVPAAGACALLAIGLGAGTPRSQQAVVTVTVDVRCSGERVELSVEPWTAELAQGDEIEWVLAPDADADELTISNKRGAGGWPFASSPPYRGGRSDPPRGREMKPNQAGNRYNYNIELTCSHEGSGPYQVVIDPAMVIKG